VLIARFRRHYQDPSLWSSPEYRTPDHVIPFGMFWIYLRAISANLALERLSETRAISNALAQAFSKNGVPDSIRRDQRDGYVAE